MCRIGSAGGTSRVRGVQLLPRPPPERPPLSSRQWSRRCCRHSREDTAGEQLAHITRWRRRRHGWRRYSRKKQDVGNRETGTHETQPNSRAGRVVQLIGAEWSGRLGSCRVTWAAPNPASVARGPGDAPSPPSDPRKHHHPPSCLDLRIDPPLWDVLPVRPKFCLLSEDR